MSILRDQRAVAMEDVLAALDAAAEGHADAAGILDPGDVAAVLTELAGRRRALAEELADAIRALGEPPHQPDPDRTLVAKVVRHGKALLVRDEALSLVRERERVEDELARRIADLRASEVAAELSDEVHALLDRARDEVDAARRRLADARVALTDPG